MKKLSICILCLLGVYTTPTFAYKSYGSGNNSCGEWVNVRQTGNYYTEAQWILGYISSYGYYVDKPELKIVDAQALMTWMDNYCQKNPLNSMEDGAQALIKALATNNN